MKIFVITPDWEYPEEIDIVKQLFEEGLERLHLRKPDYTKDDFINYLNAIPQKYHKKIVIHSLANKSLVNKFGLKGLHINSDERVGPNYDFFKVSFLKLLQPSITITTTFRTQRNLKKANHLFDYIILNNMFKSRGKENFKPFHDWTKVENSLKSIHHKVFARGGITENKVQEVRNLGFHGATIMSEIWNSENPVSEYLVIEEKAKRNPALSGK